jgi:ATP-dependent DNA helicase RecG
VEELARHVLERSGQTWDTLPSPWGIERVDHAAVVHFARLARERLPHVDAQQPERVLQNLNLLVGDRLTNGGVLLFARAPQQLYPLARLRIGVFRSPTEIVDSHEFEGTLWQQLDDAMNRFRRLLQVRFEVKVTAPSLEGLQRKDVWEYPLEALREAVINALIHRDYTMTADIQIRLYDDRLEIWSLGELPPPLRPESLRAAHGSYPRNPLLARAFYFAGLIEQWGTGTTKIISLCREHGLPEPEFENWQGGVRVTFLKDPYTPERLRAMGLNERQVQALLYMKTHGSIGNKEYRQLTGAKERTATAELGDLVEKGLLERIGSTGRGTRYAARKAQMAQ